MTSHPGGSIAAIRFRLKGRRSAAWIAIALAAALVSLPAIAIATLSLPTGAAPASALPPPVRPSASRTNLVSTPDTALHPSEASPVAGPGWEALSHASNGVSPSDVQLAVSPDYIVEAVNSALGIFTKEGRSLANTNLSVLFSSGSDLVGDPRILYDAFSGRWFVSAGDFSRGQVLLAVSKTGDPTGNWSAHRVPSTPSSSCLDQPILGVGTWNVIVSVNVFSSCTVPPFTFQGSQYWVLNKTDMVAGAANPASWTSLRNTAQFSVHPVRMESPSPVQYMVSTLWDAGSAVSVFLQSFAVTGSPPGAVEVAVTDHQMATAQLPPPAPQRGSFYNVDTGDFRIADALWSRGVLWLAFNDQCRTPFYWTACARLIEFDTEANAIVQDFWVSSTLRDYFYPAIALDGSGNLAVVVGVSSTNDYPGLLVTGRLRDDPAGEFQPPLAVKSGSGPEESGCSASENRCRYGDYFGASPDPADPTRVWLAGQFARGTTAGWGTYIFPAHIEAMLTLNYTVDTGSPPSNGPRLHYVRNGTVVAGQIGPTHTTFLADPGTSWQIDSSFLSPSGDARYLARPSEEEHLHGIANRSSVTSLAYQLQYPVSMDVVSGGGSIAYAFDSTTGTVESGTNATFFVFPGTVVTLTARPSSLLYSFSGWSGDLTGPAATQAVTVGERQSIVALFEPNWALIAAIVTTGAIAAVAPAVLVHRRRRKAKPPAFESIIPPPPPMNPPP